MARPKNQIDMAKVKAELAKAGATANQIKEITSSLAEKVKLSALEKERKALQRSLDKVEAQIAKLNGTTSASAAPKTKAKKANAPKQIGAEKVLAFLQKNSDSALRREEIARGMKVDSKALASALSTLVDEKKVKRAGQRRGTTYTV